MEQQLRNRFVVSRLYYYKNLLKKFLIQNIIIKIRHIVVFRKLNKIWGVHFKNLLFYKILISTY